MLTKTNAQTTRDTIVQKLENPFAVWRVTRKIYRLSVFEHDVKICVKFPKNLS